MSNKANRKLTDINHVRGLAKKMSYELKADIDIIKNTKAGIGVCFDIVESRKNKGGKVETVAYSSKSDKVRKNRSEDVLQDSGNSENRTTPKKKAKKAKSVTDNDD